ncbi:unnamed protein product, partial [Prorocentrum cordatum]
ERATRFPALLAPAPCPGPTILETQSVGGATRAGCERSRAAFASRATHWGRSLASAADAGSALAAFFREKFFCGGETGDAWKLMAAFAFARSDLGARWGRLPRVARAAVGCVIYARLTALTFGLCLRPRGALDLAQTQLVPPGRATAATMRRWR